MPTQIRAKLSKAKRKVVCGRPYPDGNVCGQELAFVSHRGGLNDGGNPELQFSSGWQRGEDGALRLTKRSAKRVREGGRPGFRHGAPAIVGSTKGIYGQIELRFRQHDLREHPLKVLCPRCHALNLVPPDLLDPPR
jgi:hypothetical protein